MSDLAKDQSDRVDSALTPEMRARIERYLPRYPTKQAVVLPALHIVQQQLRCVPDWAVIEIGRLLGLAPAQVHDTLSFYGFFRPESNRLGKVRCWVCRSLACSLRGGEQMLQYLCDQLQVEPGQTNADRGITVEVAECLGVCEAAPCLLVDGGDQDGTVAGDLSRERIDDLLNTLC